MKNIFSEYINIVGYLVTGVVFFVCVSIMFNNIFNVVQSKVRYENKITYEATSKLSEVKHLLTTGQSDNDDYLTLVNSFKVCYQKFNDKQLSSVIYKDKISINDSYKFLQLYDKLIIKECFNDQIYKNLDGDSKRMLKFNIEEINISLSYIKNNISNDSRSYFGTLNQNSYEKVNNSYTTLFNLYSNTVNIFYDLVNSYYNGGVIND